MKLIWQLVYNIVLLPLIYLVALIIAIFHRKVRAGFLGRRRTFPQLKNHFPSRDPNRLVFWFHSASHGEFEQIRPILAGLKEVEPDFFCVVSFFSPSGYRNVEDSRIDCKIYLPGDFYWNCWRALRLIRPYKLIFAAYDVWPNLVWCARRLGIKTTLFAARLPKKSAKQWPIIRSFYRQVYSSMDSVYTVSERDHIEVRKLLAGKSRSLVRVLGNPRYDRVKQIADKFTINRTESVLERSMRLIVGSVWPDDENVILSPILELMRERSELSLYWVPHEPTSKFLSRTMRMLSNAEIQAKLMSECRNGEIEQSRAVIVDRVGMLAELYWKGRIAYVGGGFSSGIHNVMEPAIARLPTVFGPRFHNSDAAEQLIDAGGGFSVSTQEEFRTTLQRLMDDREFFLKSSLAATSIIHSNIGSATRVVRGILRD